MEKNKFLPLGTVVIIEGGVKKFVILARGAFASIKGEQRYFDYGACTYPEGVIGDAMIYFNHEDIRKIVYEGYRDEDEELMQENLKKNIAMLKEQFEEAQE